MGNHSFGALSGLALSAALAACSGAGSTIGGTAPTSTLGGLRSGAAQPAQPSTVTPVDPNLIVAPGFTAAVIANVPQARELAVAYNGDLIVGTKGASVAIVPNADSATAPGAAQTLVTLPDTPAAGVAIGPNSTLYVGTQTAVWKLRYVIGTTTATDPVRIAAVRTGSVAPNSDGDLHHTTSVAVEWTTVFAAVGSSCNACTEVDPTRAAIMSMGLNGENFRVYATHVRNAMALAFNPHTYFLWAGGAGQDDLTTGHPYEYFDAINEHPAGSSWGWPACEENRVAYTAGANCSAVIVPHVELPAYSTIVGATFYPLNPKGPYAFPAAYRGGLFLAAHGSWHATSSGAARVGPQVDFVPMSASGWDAATPIDWANPSAQFTPFFSGFQIPGTAQFRGRPTGVSFGPGGSLFVADDQTGNIYRIRPL